MKNTLTKSGIDFLSKRKLALILSAALLVVSMLSLVGKGLVYGIDFTGGTLVEVSFEQPVELGPLRKGLEEAGFSDASIQHFGTAKDILVRLVPKEGMNNAGVSTQVMDVVSKAGSAATLRRVEFVGPQIGDELAEDGGLALLYALLGILAYVAWRFEYRFALGSVAALGHDVILTLGLFSLFGFEFDLTVLAALLAVIGYSLNDTIVVFDRIRENFRKMRKGSPVEIMNASLNQTISRTLVTSLTTLLVLVALFFLGGEIIHNFSLALMFGVIVGTYSSIFIASPVVLIMGVSKSDLMVPEKEGELMDDRP